MMQPKVLVSHPSKQHAGQLVYALQESGYLSKFITSVWYKPDKFPYKFISLLPIKLGEFIEDELKKRYDERIDGSFVEQFPIFEVIREATYRLSKGYKGEQGDYSVNRIHDWYVSKRIEKIKPDIVIGYEISSLRTFKKAREFGIITVLDLAQVHYKFIDELRQRYSELESIFDSRILLSKIGSLKEEELKYTDHIMVLSSLAKKSLIEHNIPEDKIHVLNLGFEPGKFKQKGSYRKDGIFKILYVGAITKRKGIRLLLEAYRQLNLDNAELILIGGMADAEDILRKYDGMYRYISYLDHEQLVYYYQDADVFVFPSYLDGWGMVVIEAMACGTPVIVSENTGAKDGLVDGLNGFIVPVDDASALRERILFFYNNRDRVEYFGRNARKQAENYIWENYRKRMRKVILEIWKNESASCLERFIC